jgi:hypothetical protein
MCQQYDQWLPHVHRAHLALFYLFGTYLHMSNRLVGIRFVCHITSSITLPQVVHRLLNTDCAL